MAELNQAAQAARAARRPFSWSAGQKALLLITAAYCAWSLAHMGVSGERLADGWRQGAKFLASMFPPELGKMDELWQGIKETLQIAVLATAAGLALSLPVGLMAAANLSPAPLQLEIGRAHV